MTTNSIPLSVEPRLDHRSRFSTNIQGLLPLPEMFDAVGGQSGVERLVENLYSRFETDPVLRPAFSRNFRQELEPVKHFFEDWFGGKSGYFDSDWPPGLQAGHCAISISRGMAGRWVGHFLDALAETAPDPVVVQQIKPLISRIAMALVNRSDEPIAGERLRCGCHSVEVRFLKCIQQDDAEALMNLAVLEPQMYPKYEAKLLLIAALQGKAKCAERLLLSGVSANVVGMLPGSDTTKWGFPKLGVTPLCAALVAKRTRLVNLLVEFGACYDIFTAALVGDRGAIEKLLEVAPELVNACDPAHDLALITPLTVAVLAQQVDIALLLLERGATVGKYSVRLLRAAANGGQEPLTEILLEHGALAKGIGAGSWVLFPRIAERLIAHGANVNSKPGAWIGMCCTGNSGHKENVTLVRAFLRYGADVSALYRGRTALHCAAKAGYASTVEALIEYGADVNAPDENGLTPLDAVEEAGRSVDREPVRRVLVARGGRKSFQ
jgi:ankyrin repeat protein/truncated hemoglobin YjbI